MSPHDPSFDRAGKAYWDASWSQGACPQAIDPRRSGAGNYTNRRFHGFFCDMFGKIQRTDRPLRLLEVGCANSAWLPYFAREFGFDISGLDYSEIGCTQERAILRSAGVTGDVVCADLFAPPSQIKESFDVVVTFGVVEHFGDTARVVQALSYFLKPGGFLYTMIPNLSGAIGTVQKTLNRAVYDIHVPLDRESLGLAHVSAGLEVKECEYFISTDFGVCNLNGIRIHSPVWMIKKVALALLTRLSMCVWWCERITGGYWPARRTFSPYINCLAQRVT
jgi:2-polyprenyl-3-methyl-5-hydroxy-6-metoxy-1,4-benzoquinol methylase